MFLKQSLFLTFLKNLSNFGIEKAIDHIELILSTVEHNLPAHFSFGPWKSY